jgi:hypothetical protein
MSTLSEVVLRYVFGEIVPFTGFLFGSHNLFTTKKDGLEGSRVHPSGMKPTDGLFDISG